MKAHCCFIPEDEQGKTEPKNCSNEAEWNVFSERHDHPYGGTQACTAHVGALLQDGHNRVWPIEAAG